jgi:hypothetical protein
MVTEDPGVADEADLLKVKSPVSESTTNPAALAAAAYCCVILNLTVLLDWIWAEAFAKDARTTPSGAELPMLTSRAGNETAKKLDPPSGVVAQACSAKKAPTTHAVRPVAVMGAARQGKKKRETTIKTDRKRDRELKFLSRFQPQQVVSQTVQCELMLRFGAGFGGKSLAVGWKMAKGVSNCETSLQTHRRIRASRLTSARGWR